MSHYYLFCSLGLARLCYALVGRGRCGLHYGLPQDGKGDAGEAARVAPDIMANGLRIDYSRHGSAAWAYYTTWLLPVGAQIRLSYLKWRRNGS
jgi:hypothetical protein